MHNLPSTEKDLIGWNNISTKTSMRFKLQKNKDVFVMLIDVIMPAISSN